MSVLSLIAGPLLCILAVWVSVTRRHRRRRPLVLAVIPLALTSISIQLVAAAWMINSGFRTITGIAAVTPIFTPVVSSLLWRFVEVAACVAIGAMIAPWVWGRERENEAPGSPLGSLKTIAWSAAALVTVAALVWFYRDLVELCMLIMDSCRSTEATLKLRDLGLAGVAALLTSRIVMLIAGASVVTLGLIGIGFRCLHAERRTKWGVAGSVAVTVAALAWCGIGISAESRAQIYLAGIGHHSGQTHQTYQSPTSVNSFRLPDADRDDAVILTVTRDGQLFVGHLFIEPKDRVDMVAVVDEVKDRLVNRLDKSVYVRADARASYGTIAQLFSQLRTAGVDLVGLLTSGRNQQNNSCATSGLEVVIPEAPLPVASDSARPSQHSQFVGVLRAPAIVPMGTSPRDPIVVQVLRGPGGVQWKINRSEVSSLNDLTAQLGNPNVATSSPTSITLESPHTSSAGSPWTSIWTNPKSGIASPK